MTKEENLYWLNKEIETWENECQSKHPIKEALYAARKALEQEPATKNDCAEQNGCITCSLDDGDDCCRKLYEESMQEPTTKNDLGVDCSLDDFIKYCKKTFGVELTVKKSDNPDTYAKLFGTTNNDLEVDCINRQAAITFVCKNIKEILKDTTPLEVKLSDDYIYENVAKIMRNPKVLPSITPQKPALYKIKAEVLEYIDDIDIAAEICDIFDKYEMEDNALITNNDLEEELEQE